MPPPYLGRYHSPERQNGTNTLHGGCRPWLAACPSSHQLPKMFFSCTPRLDRGGAGSTSPQHPHHPSVSNILGGTPNPTYCGRGEELGIEGERQLGRGRGIIPDVADLHLNPGLGYVRCPVGLALPSRALVVSPGCH